MIRDFLKDKLPLRFVARKPRKEEIKAEVIDMYHVIKNDSLLMFIY